MPADHRVPPRLPESGTLDSQLDTFAHESEGMGWNGAESLFVVMLGINDVVSGVEGRKARLRRATEWVRSGPRIAIGYGLQSWGA
jgi:hypothetical protein